MSSFVQRRLRMTLILSGANSVFPGTNSNTLILENMRMSAVVQGVARLSTQADIRIFGMKPSDMEALTVTWANPPVVLDNLVIVEADSGKGYVQIFKGTITEAQPIFSAAPNVFFNVLAVTGYFRKINAAEPTSYPEATDIKTVAADLVGRMGFTFVDGGASGTFNPGAYFWGSLWDQFQQACDAANADYYVQGDTILITQAGRPGGSKPSVVLSKDTGLIGYPQFERSGLLVGAIFDPAFVGGTPIDIQSSVPNATGRWFPYSLLHTLEAFTPGGQWASQLRCLRVFT